MAVELIKSTYSYWSTPVLHCLFSVPLPEYQRSIEKHGTNTKASRSSSTVFFFFLLSMCCWLLAVFFFSSSFYTGIFVVDI